MNSEGAYLSGSTPDAQSGGDGVDELCNEEGEVQYTAQQNGGKVTLTARGQHRTGGFAVRFQDTPIDVFPPEYELRHVRPTGMVTQAITPFEQTTRFPAADPVGRVVVHDAQGRHEIEVTGNAVAPGGAPFVGTSESGDFGEALAAAIAAAKEGLHSTLVLWTLRDVSGESGGFVAVNRLSVTIEARVPG